jgi:hypothetical protein
VTTNEDTAAAITLKASDADGDPLTYAIITPPQHGSLSGTLPQVTYKPRRDYNGTDSFTFKVNDGKADSNTAVVSLTIRPVNDPPVAVNDTAQGARRTTLTIDVLANDSDVDGDPLTITAVGVPASRKNSVTTNGSRVFFTPHSSFQGTDSFTYTIRDPSGATAQAMVTVTIQ